MGVLDWDEYFIQIAKAVSLNSTCSRRQVGCILVKNRRILSTGYNGGPSGTVHCVDGGCPRGLKSYAEVPALSQYKEGAGACIAIHAEDNAKQQAHRFGLSTEGADAYVWGAPPCLWCKTEVLMPAGIVRVVWAEEVFEVISSEGDKWPNVHRGVIDL